MDQRIPRSTDLGPIREEEKTVQGTDRLNSRCFSWRMLEVHGVLPSPAGKERRVSTLPYLCWPDIERSLATASAPLLNGPHLKLRVSRGLSHILVPCHIYMLVLCARQSMGPCCHCLRRCGLSIFHLGFLPWHFLSHFHKAAAYPVLSSIHLLL